jgi:iron complex outermembrane receptor protein
MPFLVDNKLNGKTYGVEVAADWQVTDFWKLAASFALLDMDLTAEKSSTDPNPEEDEHRSPRHTFNLRSHLNLPWKLEFDTLLYYVDSLSQSGIPSYVRVDFRLGWRPTEKLEVSLALQNAFDDRHPEFVSEVFDRQVEVQRSFAVLVALRF